MYNYDKICEIIDPNSHKSTQKQMKCIIDENYNH